MDSDGSSSMDEKPLAWIAQHARRRSSEPPHAATMLPSTGADGGLQPPLLQQHSQVRCITPEVTLTPDSNAAAVQASVAAAGVVTRRASKRLTPTPSPPPPSSHGGSGPAGEAEAEVVATKRQGRPPKENSAAAARIAIGPGAADMEAGEGPERARRQPPTRASGRLSLKRELLGGTAGQKAESPGEAGGGMDVGRQAAGESGSGSKQLPPGPSSKRPRTAALSAAHAAGGSCNGAHAIKTAANPATSVETALSAPPIAPTTVEGDRPALVTMAETPLTSPVGLGLASLMLASSSPWTPGLDSGASLPTLTPVAAPVTVTMFGSAGGGRVTRLAQAPSAQLPPRPPPATMPPPRRSSASRRLAEEGGSAGGRELLAPFPAGEPSARSSQQRMGSDRPRGEDRGGGMARVGSTHSLLVTSLGLPSPGCSPQIACDTPSAGMLSPGGEPAEPPGHRPANGQPWATVLPPAAASLPEDWLRLCKAGIQSARSKSWEQLRESIPTPRPPPPRPATGGRRQKLPPQPGPVVTAAAIGSCAAAAAVARLHSIFARWPYRALCPKMDDRAPPSAPPPPRPTAQTPPLPPKEASPRPEPTLPSESGWAVPDVPAATVAPEPSKARPSSRQFGGGRLPPARAVSPGVLQSPATETVAAAASRPGSDDVGVQRPEPAGAVPEGCTATTKTEGGTAAHQLPEGFSRGFIYNYSHTTMCQVRHCGRDIIPSDVATAAGQPIRDCRLYSPPLHAPSAWTGGCTAEVWSQEPRGRHGRRK